MTFSRTMFVGLALLCAAAPACAVDALTRVDVSLGDVSINKVPFLIASDTGIFAKNGLEAHMLITPNAAAAVRGDGVSVPADFISATAGMSPISIGGGAPMIYGVGRNPNANLRVIVSTTEDMFRPHLVAKPGIDSIPALKGKRLGTSPVGTVLQYGMLVFLKKMGWQDGKDITLVPGEYAIESLKSGKVDAFTANVLATATAPAEGYKVAGNFADYKIPMAGSGIMVEAKWLAANRDTVARFVKATVEATAVMKTNKPAFNAALAKWFNITDPKVQAGMYPEAAVFPDKPYPTVEGIKGAMDVYSTDNLKKHKPEDFYDSSFVAALDKSGFLDHPLN